MLLTLATLVFEGRLALRLSRRLRAEQGPTPGAVAAPAGAPAAPSALWGRVLLGLGGLLATGGGLLILLLLLGSSGNKERAAILIGGALLGGLPLGLGLLLFRAGLHRLNQVARLQTAQ